MQGVGSYTEGSEQSSSKTLVQGLAFAIGLHIMLLSFQLDFGTIAKDDASPLSVSIVVEEQQLDAKKVEQVLPAKDDVKQPDPIDPKPQIKELKTTEPEPKEESGATIRFSTSSEKFQRFLQSETDRHIQTNTNEQEGFSATFKPYFAAPIIPADIKYEDYQGPLGGGQYKVRKDGKVTCVLVFVPMTFDDLVSDTGGGTKDCTPKQKFDPNLRINTRE